MLVEKFHEHKYQTSKNLPCPDCGRKVRRSRTFTGTSNPFTTPPFMDWRQMRERLLPEIEAWQARPERCASCRDKVRAAVEAGTWSLPDGAAVLCAKPGRWTYVEFDGRHAVVRPADDVAAAALPECLLLRQWPECVAIIRDETAAGVQP